MVPFIQCARFEDDEFPEWWYSPARAVKVAVVAVPSSDELPGAQDELSVAKGAQLSSEKKLHEPILPRNPSPRDRVPGRPAIAELSTAELVTPPDSSTELRTAEHSSFSDEEINLLASNNVYRSPDSGEWFHREEYPDGRLMITPVNPNAELRRARGKTPPLTLVPFIRCVKLQTLAQQFTLVPFIRCALSLRGRSVPRLVVQSSTY